MCDPAAIRNESGFTLIEVLLATALFVFVAIAGFEALRALGAQVTLLARRSAEASQLAAATTAMRSDALSSAAVWKPASACGDAVSFMQKEAGNATSFVLYVSRAAAGTAARPALYRAVSTSGPLDPCDPALAVGPVVDAIAGFRVTSLRASDLAVHADAVSGQSDGAIFRAGGIPSIAIDSHDRDYDGTPIRTGNQITEVSIDAAPAQATLDLVAGNRPSGFTSVLTYACGARCRGTAVFPETRGSGLTNCAIGFDLPDMPAFYAPAAGQPIYVPAGGGRLRPVISSYAVNVGVIFAFTGPAGARAQEELYVNAPAWSVPGMQDTPSIASDGTVTADYRANAIKRAGAANVFAEVNGAATLAPQLALCAALNAESNDVHG